MLRKGKATNFTDNEVIGFFAVKLGTPLHLCHLHICIFFTTLQLNDNFRIIGQARSSFHLGVLESVYIKIQDPVLCRQQEFVFSLKLFN